jgi:radical SAM/Cys-rich protein
VYRKSIDALLRLNEVGYGRLQELSLTLVYNPVGPTIAPAEGPLEDAYRAQLKERFGIEFTRLICITNLPITRFKLYLKQNGQLESYQRLLIENFNPGTVDGLMCRSTINVGWEGDLFDCDFNQMAGLPMGGGRRRFLWELEPGPLENACIVTAGHCFGCTAGHGSSCGGTLA